MALTFGNSSADNVNASSSAAINNLAALTHLFWLLPTTRTSLRGLVSKSVTAITSGFVFRLNGTTGNVEYLAVRATTNSSYITNSTPLASLSTWYRLAVTFDIAASPTTHIYIGSLTAAMAEAAYGTSIDGSGAYTSDSGNTFRLGLIGTSPLQGRIATYQLFNRVLTLAELQEQQFRPHPISGNVIYWQLGFNGTGAQADWSGNGKNGTTSGSLAVSAHVPLRPLFAARSILGPFSPIPHAVTDSATLSDSSGAIAQAVSDSAALADSISDRTFDTQLDSAALSDSSSLSAAQNVVDSATLTDTSSGIAQNATDTATLTDAAALAQALTDAAALTDTATLAIIVNDAATLADSSSAIAQSSSDTGTLTESSTLAQLLTDTATLIESAVLAVAYSRTDSFALTDNSGDGIAQAVAPLGVDTATLSDSITGRQLALYDSMALTGEASDRRRLLTTTDNAVLSESAVLVVFLSRADTATLTDAHSTFTTTRTVTDGAVLTDTSTQPPSALSRVDSIVLADNAALLVLWSRTDSAALSDGTAFVGVQAIDAFIFSDRARKANAGAIPKLRDPLHATPTGNGRGLMRVIDDAQMAGVVNSGRGGTQVIDDTQEADVLDDGRSFTPLG